MGNASWRHVKFTSDTNGSELKTLEDFSWKGNLGNDKVGKTDAKASAPSLQVHPYITLVLHGGSVQYGVLWYV